MRFTFCPPSSRGFFPHLQATSAVNGFRNDPSYGLTPFTSANRVIRNRRGRTPALDAENGQAQAPRMNTDGKQFSVNRVAAATGDGDDVGVDCPAVADGLPAHAGEPCESGEDLPIAGTNLFRRNAGRSPHRVAERAGPAQLRRGQRAAAGRAARHHRRRQIQELADAITTRGGEEKAPGDKHTEAGKLLEAVEANVPKLAKLRRQAQLAADKARRWRTPAVSTLSKAFLLSPDRPMKDWAGTRSQSRSTDLQSAWVRPVHAH